jgi:glucose/arabinose dehydrogenase
MNMNRRTILKRSAYLLFAAAVIGGCSSDSTTEPQVLGRAMVSIKDDTNQPVGGILVYLFATGNTATPWAAATTGADGTAEFSASLGGVKAQSYVARVMTLTNYDLAAGEVNNKPITVTANQTSTVTFTLTKKVAGPA